MKKKLLSICLVVAIAVLAITGASLAYFTDNEKAVNTFTMGNVDIELTENWQEPETVLPGIAYTKDPTVTNIGKNEAWIRVDVTLSHAAEFLKAAENHGIADLSSMFAFGSDFSTNWIAAGTPDHNTDDNTLTFSYLYVNKLAKDSSTSTLFESVTVPAAFNNADMAAIGENFTITVTAHAMQDANFENVQAAFAVYTLEEK